MKAPLALAASVLAAALSLGAQTAPCYSANDANNTVIGTNTNWSLAGPTITAWQFTPTAPLSVQSLRLFLGNSFGASVGSYMNLAIWSNSATNLPQASLASGTWKLLTADMWQGTNLDALLTLQANQAYWIVLTEPGWSTLPVEPGGSVSMPVARFQGGAWSAGATPEALKVRLYTGLLDDQHLSVRGSSCATANGRLGSVLTNAASQAGNAAFFVEGTGLPAGTVVYLVLGANPSWIPFPVPLGNPQCMIHTDMIDFWLGFTGTGDVRSLSPAGHVTYAIPIPGNNALIGFGLNTQIAALEVGSPWPLPIVTTNAVRFTIY